MDVFQQHVQSHAGQQEAWPGDEIAGETGAKQECRRADVVRGACGAARVESVARESCCSFSITVTRSSRRVGNLPAEASSFVGRRQPLAELRSKLSTARLVSIVGPGGVGKTAWRSESQVTSRLFEDGAWLVELAELRDSALVANGVMAAFDLRDQAGSEPLALVLSYLRDKQ